MKSKNSAKVISIIAVLLTLTGIAAFTAHYIQTRSDENGLVAYLETADEYISTENADMPPYNGIIFETEDSAGSKGQESTPDSSKTSSTSSKKNTDSDKPDNSDTDTDSDKNSPDYSLMPVMSDFAAPENVDPLLMLVNRYNPLPDDYTFDTVTLSNGKLVHELIYEDLQQMFDDARMQGIDPYVSEGYRTTQEQEEMMQLYIDDYIAQGCSPKEASRLALNYVAKPGTSEHEAGLALDINGDSEEVYEWLAENAYKYGFILRYPSGKEYITGISYEPWHYRYVGKEYALEIYESGECLEEFVQRKYS